MFDFADARNPFADYSVVFVPYCTSDVFIGNTRTEYAPGLTVHHKGHVDGTAALDAELRAGHAISLDADDVLLRLARAEGRSLRVTQLAERVLIPPSTLTRRVDQLVEQGLIERSRQPGDARVVVVQLTDRGLALLRRAARTHLQNIHTHFTGKLDLNRLAEVAAGLEVVVGPHEEH